MKVGLPEPKNNYTFSSVQVIIRKTPLKSKEHIIELVKADKNITITHIAETLGRSMDAQQFAKVIANWTISNMQANDGHFYYQKFKTHTHKISYMRWSNAWMFLALSHLINP